MAKSDDLRIGIVGAGGIARRHVACLKGTAEARITAILDVDPDRAGQLAEATGAQAVGNVSELIDEVDAAFVLTPPRERIEVIRELAGAGKAMRLIKNPL